MQINVFLQSLSTTVLNLLRSDVWPIQASLGDLLLTAVLEVPNDVWSHAFSCRDRSWLLSIISVEVPRTYNISTFSTKPLPTAVDLTVTRSEHQACDLLQSEYTSRTRSGVSSAFLNPNPFSVTVDGAVIDEVLL
jgi:hypothetical protein